MCCYFILFYLFFVVVFCNCAVILKEMHNSFKWILHIQDATKYLIIKVRIIGDTIFLGFLFLLQEMVCYYIYEVMTSLFLSHCLSTLVQKWWRSIHLCFYWFKTELHVILDERHIIWIVQQNNSLYWLNIAVSVSGSWVVESILKHNNSHTCSWLKTFLYQSAIY